MQKTDTLYTAYVEVLKEELLPAMGCTEPIAIAYAAAAARRILNELPCEVCVTASGNIIKNVKSVFVPNTGGLRGIPAAAAAGIIAGHDELLLEVISKATEAAKMIHLIQCLDSTFFQHLNKFHINLCGNSGIIHCSMVMFLRNIQCFCHNV